MSLAFSLGPQSLRMTVPAASAIAVCAALSVWLAGRRPMAGLAVACAMAVALPAFRSTFEAMDLVIVLVVFQVAMRSELRAWVLAVIAFAALTVTDVWQRLAFDRSFLEPSVLYPVLLTALSVGLGLQSRRVRRQNAEILALQDADRRRAVSDERRRIARDLHDVAAHHLASLVVRNKVALRVDTEESLVEAARFSARTAGEALDSLRQVVGVLSGAESAPRDPQPTIADLGEIIARMQSAGLRVEPDIRDVRPVPRGVEVAVVRIAQEAMANALRHRGPGGCWVGLRRVGDSVVLTVEDDGGPIADATGTAAEVPRSGYGLIGMRERAESCDGRLDIGSSSRGGWRVEASMPAALPADAARP